MSSDTLFSEKQRFKQWWIWLILIGMNLLFMIGIFKQVIGGETFGNKPMSNIGLIIGAVILMLITLLFLTFRLETEIKKEGIYVRFFPFHIKFRYFPFDSIKTCYIRQYKPISEYGGWGIRYSLSQNGKALNVSGNMGLQIEFVNNKKLLIGTQKPNELKEFLHKFGQLKE